MVLELYMDVFLSLFFFLSLSLSLFLSLRWRPIALENAWGYGAPFVWQ